MPGFCSVCLPQLLQRGIGEPPLIPLLLALLQLWFPHGAEPWGCQELSPLLLLRAEPFPPFQSLCYFPSLPYFWPCWPPARHPPNRKKSSGSGEGGQSLWDASRGSIPADERAFGATTRPRRATGVPACLQGGCTGSGASWGPGAPGGTSEEPGATVCWPGTWRGRVPWHRAGDSRAALPAAISGGQGPAPGSCCPFIFNSPPRDKRGRGEGRGIPLLPPVWAATGLLGSFPVFALLPSESQIRIPSVGDPTKSVGLGLGGAREGAGAGGEVRFLPFLEELGRPHAASSVWLVEASGGSEEASRRPHRWKFDHPRLNRLFDLF